MVAPWRWANGFRVVVALWWWAGAVHPVHTAHRGPEALVAPSQTHTEARRNALRYKAMACESKGEG